MHFCYFAIISSWKRVGSFFWKDLNPLHHRMLCAKFGWNWPCDSGEEFFLKLCQMYFCYFIIISPWKWAWHFMNPLYLSMLCAKFGWNWRSGSGEEVENMKSFQTDRLTDRRTDRQSEKLTWVLSSGELKTSSLVKMVEPSLVMISTCIHSVWD